jgi:FdhD protein
MELTKVGVSACLVGEEVRYNGAHKKDDRLLDVLGARFELVPVCPEVEMGLGVPREPMNLYRTPAGVRMITVDSRVDHTDGMNAWAAQRLDELAREDLSGYVLKSRSPSCGLHVGGHDDRGVFAAALVERFPQMPVAEESQLADPAALQQFIDRVDAYSRRSPRRPVTVIRVTSDGAREARDVAAVEEPLEVRLHDRSFAVIMRTPGADRQLAAGFLLAEGIITSADDLGAVEHCVHPDQRHVHNVVNVFLVGEAATRVPAVLEERRNVVANASCGICGRVTIESLRTRASRLAATVTFTRQTIQAMPAQLRARQPLFDDTGALHAAAIVSPAGECVAAAEDVGRHNAVDKVIGELLLASRLPLTGHALAVSGRTSYEIVQKAWLAGIEVICAVSAPSSLAIELADEAGITLIGFARDRGFNIYSHATRVGV